MKKTILLLEDWPAISNPLADRLTKLSSDIEVVVFAAESEFRSFCAIQIVPPFAVIGDAALPWSRDAVEQENQPQYVKDGTFRRAGARCRKFLRTLPDCEEVPWIYFTLYDLEKVDPDASTDPFCESIDKDLSSRESFGYGYNRIILCVSRILTPDSPKTESILREGLKTPLADCTTDLSIH